jgi:hypothetical protein
MRKYEFLPGGTCNTKFDSRQNKENAGVEL